jgi:hypothetical protein
MQCISVSTTKNHSLFLLQYICKGATNNGNVFVLQISHFVIFIQSPLEVLTNIIFFTELYIFYHFQIVFYLGLFFNRNTVYVFTLN